MSFFPSPDPQKLRTTFNQNSPFYVQAPPTPAHSHPSPGRHSLPNSAIEASFGSNSPSIPWQPHAPRGLGLMPMPASEGQMDYDQRTPSAAPMGASFAWPSEFTSSLPVSAGVDMMRRDSWTEGCNPVPTLLPTAPAWDHSSMPHAGYQSPDHRSEYSASTQASSFSSPYAHGHGLLQAAATSPSIKMENPVEIGSGQLHYIPESRFHNQSMVVRPGDLVTHPPSTIHEAATSPITGSADEEIDVKPDISSLRPGNRRAFSSEDYQLSDFDGRPKRGFTKPEAAICSCDQCGKLFQRSYNLKAHLETHDPNRCHPHACDYPGCDKQFVRRTDLVRHEQSVHLKIRNFFCPMCDGSFARKDTLRRHVDDGCPKRPEVKKRLGKARRPSSASISRRSSSYALQNNSPVGSPLRQPVQYF